MRKWKYRKISFALLIFSIVLMTMPNVQGSGEPDLWIAENDVFFSKSNISSDESIVVYAVVHNSGASANAMVRFYDGDMSSLIGEDEVTVAEDASALSMTIWAPDFGTQKVFVSIDDITPSDSDPANNEANVTIEISESEHPLNAIAGEATLESGIERVIPIEVEVLQDMDNIEIEVLYDGDLEITPLSLIQDAKSGDTLKFYLKIRASNLEADRSFDNRTILVRASNGNFMSNIAELKIFIHPSVEYNNWWAATVATATAGSLGAIAAIGSTEIGKYKFLSYLVPLYTKLKRNEILDHYVRGKIHGYILANPGDHYNSIKKILGISNSSFAYHLSVLEREGVIKSRRDGIYKRFYPSEMRIPENGGLKESQRIIIEKIKEFPGISQKDIATTLGVSSSTVNYHLQDLIKDEIVITKRMGMKVGYYLGKVDN
jgi:predicted transcriptional regulator